MEKNAFQDFLFCGYVVGHIACCREGGERTVHHQRLAASQIILAPRDD
jgi:hypothetical protein